MTSFVRPNPPRFRKLTERARKLIRELEQEKYEGKLTLQKEKEEKKITVYEREGIYKGYVNEKGDPQGVGTLTYDEGEYEGTWKGGKIDGYCKYSVRLFTRFV